MLSKKGRLLYALHTVKTLFRDAGIENAKVEVELKDGTVETIDRNRIIYYRLHKWR